MLKPLLASVTVKIMAGTFAAAAATGSLAAAGALPQPAQHAISKAAGEVGISVPSPDDSVEGDVEDTEETQKREAPTTQIPERKTEVNGSSEQANHGHCVSYAAKLGLKGKVLSMVAHDKAAISTKVEEDGDPDAACLEAIENAEAGVDEEMTSPKSDSAEGENDEEVTNETEQPKANQPGHKAGQMSTEDKQHKPDAEPGDHKGGHMSDGAEDEKSAPNEHAKSGKKMTEEQPSPPTDDDEQ